MNSRQQDKEGSSTVAADGSFETDTELETAHFVRSLARIVMEVHLGTTSGVQDEGRPRRSTYVRVLADLLDDILVEVARVALETSSDVVCVLETVEHSVKDRSLRALTQLELGVLGLLVDVLHPVVVSRSSVMVDVILEGDQI